MNCLRCSTELIYNGDHETDSDLFEVQSNLSCPNCGCHVIVYIPDGWEAPPSKLDKVRDVLNEIKKIAEVSHGSPFLKFYSMLADKGLKVIDE